MREEILQSGAPVATLGAGLGTEMVLRVHVTAAGSLMLHAPGGDHFIAIVFNHHLSGHTLILEVVSLAPETPLFHLLQLRFDGTRSDAAAFSL
jgi:hypothetical protein